MLKSSVSGNKAMERVQWRRTSARAATLIDNGEAYPRGDAYQQNLEALMVLDVYADARVVRQLHLVT